MLIAFVQDLTMKSDGRSLDVVSVGSSSTSRPSPPALIAIGKQSGRGSSQPSPMVACESSSSIDPSNFLLPVMDPSKDDDEQDYELVESNVKVEDDDDDDDDGMDDGRYMGYYPHASLMVCKISIFDRKLQALFIYYIVLFFKEKSSDDDKGDGGDFDQQGGSNLDGLEMADGKHFCLRVSIFFITFLFSFGNVFNSYSNT